MFLSLMFLSFIAIGQTVNGTVKDSEGTRLPGVSVIEKNTTNGTVTDTEGNYTLTLQKENATLIFSSLGFVTREIVLKGREQIDLVLLEDVKSLDEVVVIAYGASEKRKFTGSLSTVSTDEIDQIPQTSPIQMLQGRAAGVLVEDNSGAPGSVGDILIRGVGSYNADQSPLYVIDGIPTSNFSAFNPNDIESISILKDAAATSIYGSRASNGVVLITTKKGKSGKTKITFNAQAGFSDLENPNDFRVLNATEYKEYYQEAYRNGGLNAETLMPENSDSINTAWVDDVLQTGVTQQYEVTASGGTDVVRHFVSVSYFNQKGIVIGTNFERYTGRVNLGLSPSEKLQLDINILGAFTKRDLQYADGGRSGIFSGSFNIAPTASPFASGTTPLNLNGLGYNFNLPSNAGHNPIASNDINSRTSNSYRALPSLQVTLEPIKNFTIKSSLAVDLLVSKEEAFQSKFYFAETDNGLSEANTEFSTRTNFNAIAQYEYSFGDHTITPTVGVETFKRVFTAEGAESREFGFDGISLVGEGATMLDIDSDYSAHTLFSVFSKVNYAFKDKLFLDLTYRTDGSSRFGPENRYGQFYGIGSGYDLTGEGFLQGQNILSQLRVRASYGIQGNYNIGNYSWRKTYNSQGAFIVPGGGNPGAQPEDPGNEFVQWEESVTSNVGIDFGLIGDRITGTIEYYTRGSDALLGDRLISQTSGFSSFADNIGDIQNRGFEIAISTVNIRKEDFLWRSGINLTFNNNEIQKLNTVGDTVATNFNVNIVGQPFGQWYLPQYAGVDPGTGRPLYRTVDGGLSYNTSEALTTVSGQSALNPDFYGGITNTISYKGFTFSALVYFKYGFSVYNDLRQQLSVPGTNNVSAANLARWQEPGDITDVPKADFNDPNSPQFNSTRWLEDGSFIRLRNVSLSYSLPTTLINKWGMSDVTLSLRGVNLLTFTKYSGYDPNVGDFDEDNDYPINRTITFGISANF